MRLQTYKETKAKTKTKRQTKRWDYEIICRQTIYIKDRVLNPFPVGEPDKCYKLALL